MNDSAIRARRLSEDHIGKPIAKIEREHGRLTGNADQVASGVSKGIIRKAFALADPMKKFITRVVA